VPAKREALLHLSMFRSNCHLSIRREAKYMKTAIPIPALAEANSRSIILVERLELVITHAEIHGTYPRQILFKGRRWCSAKEAVEQMVPLPW